MLKISDTQTSEGNVVLKLEGRIVGPWVGELERASERILDAGRSLKLDLVDVSYVDREGAALLRKFKRRRIVLEGCSPFLTEELKEPAAQTSN